MSNTEKIIGDIPESLRYDEAIAAIKEKLRDDPKDDPFSAVSTAGCSLLQIGIQNARDEIKRFNAAIGGDYPHGDIVMVGALMAAAAALSTSIMKRDPDAAIPIFAIGEVAKMCARRVHDSFEMLADSKLQTGVFTHKDGNISVAINFSNFEKPNDKG